MIVMAGPVPGHSHSIDWGGMGDTPLAIRSAIGDPPTRRAGAWFLIGSGRYPDDPTCDRLAHATVLGAPHAHARITRIDTTAARSAPAVLAVLSIEDAWADGLQPMLPIAQADTRTEPPCSKISPIRPPRNNVCLLSAGAGAQTSYCDDLLAPDEKAPLF